MPTRQATTQKEVVKDIMASLLENITTDGFLAIDGRWRYVYVSDMAAKILGQSRRSLLGKSVHRVHPNFRESAFYKMYDKAMLTQKMSKFEHRAPQLDRWYWVAVYPSARGLTVYFEDITRRKRVHAELKAKEQQKTDFISMASHELKTPLTSMRGFVEILSSRLKSTPDYESKLYLRKINQYVERLNKLVENLLDITKIQSGRLQLQPEPFVLCDLLDELIEDLNQTTKTWRIVFERGHRRQIKVVADRERIGEVFINLITNAQKYSPAHRKIIVRVAATARQVQVSVQDFGLGIPSNKRRDIFRKYYRLDEHNQERPGLGIGLYISGEIIALSGGKIWFTSEEGKGSTFYFTLPRAV